ncbi:MAG: acetylornithine transaminase, partial [Nocardioidaceae bacterium]|nr:acetylornithine transaminase [Nocardioidaceae bacterium]
AEGLLDHADRLGKHLRDGLAHPHVTEVRGEGLLIGISLDAEEAADTVAAAQDAGYIVNMCTPDRVRLAPPLVLTDDDADGFLAAWPAIVATAYGEDS